MQTQPLHSINPGEPFVDPHHPGEVCIRGGARFGMSHPPGGWVLRFHRPPKPSFFIGIRSLNPNHQVIKLGTNKPAKVVKFNGKEYLRF